MQAFMRRFSIRFRMLAAIGVVLCLLILIGGAGLWGLQHTAQLSDRFVTQAFQKTVTLSRLRMALADTSRFEKDMVIQYESPEQLSLASFYWERSRKSVVEQLELMQVDPQPDALPLIERMQQNLDAYVKEVEPVVQRIQTGAFDSATVANRALAKAHERYDPAAQRHEADRDAHGGAGRCFAEREPDDQATDADRICCGVGAGGAGGDPDHPGQHVQHLPSAGRGAACGDRHHPGRPHANHCRSMGAMSSPP